MLLKSFAHDDLLLAVILSVDTIKLLSELCMDANQFEICSAAFDLLTAFLTAIPTTSSKFIVNNYDFIFERLSNLIKGDHYFPQREGIVLIYNVLSIPMHMEALDRYCHNIENIKAIMNFLPNTKQSIQYNAINLFALIVNVTIEKKIEQNIAILRSNKNALVELLISLFPEKEDIEFQKRRKRMIELIKELK